MLEPAAKPSPWYKEWWAVALLAIGVMAILLGGILGVLMLYYLREIKAGRQPTFANVTGSGFTLSVTSTVRMGVVSRSDLETADDPYQGQRDAPVTVVEFVDFKCPNCKISAPILADIVAKYPTKINLIIRDFPAESLHPGATQLSEIGYCAAAQGKFWPWHDIIFERQETLTETLTTDDIYSLATAIGADPTRLQQCAQSEEARREVNSDYLTGVAAGVRGTPTFFINGEKIAGTIPQEAWVRFFDTIK